MNNIMKVAHTADEAFIMWAEDFYNEVLENKKTCDESRDGKIIAEVLNAVTVIEDPTKFFMENSIRDLNVRYAVGELLWYKSKKRSLDSIGIITKAWERFSDDGKNVNSNYGYCIHDKFDFDQWDYVKQEIVNNPNTRRAVIHIKEADKQSFNSKDVNCTVYLQFLVRDGKLHLHTHMRSNDFWMGFPYDVFQFCCMQVQMAMELGLDVGEYVHYADSLHIYERDFCRLEEGIERRKEILG